MATRKPSVQRKAQLDRRRQEDARFTYRVLLIFALAAALLFAAIWLSGRINSITAKEMNELMTLISLILSGLVLLTAAAALILRLTNLRSIAAAFAYSAAALTVALLSALFLWRFPDDGLWPLCVIQLGIALLYLLFFIYPREFSVLAVLIGGGCLGFWFLRRRLQTGMYGEITAGRVWPSRATIPLLIFAAALVLSALLLLLLRAGKGRLGSIQILPQQSHYRVLLATCGLFALGLVCTLIFGWMASWVFMIGCFVYLFVAAIYYTSKLM